MGVAGAVDTVRAGVGGIAIIVGGGSSGRSSSSSRASSGGGGPVSSASSFTMCSWNDAWASLRALMSCSSGCHVSNPVATRSCSTLTKMLLLPFLTHASR